MSHEANIHAAQTSILRELLFRPSAGYTELQKPTGLTSDHFNFHVKRLLELGFIHKEKQGKYSLTPKGKEHANKLDTDNNTIERQPKVAVMLAVTKRIKGRTHYLFQERLKHPYFGYWGFLTGKIRWGETILETAARELMEEAGLKASYKIMGVYHEHAYQRETGDLLEDKVFFVIRCSNPRGKFIEKFEGGHNAWKTPEDMAGRTVFGSFETELGIARGEQIFVEEDYRYRQQDF